MSLLLTAKRFLTLVTICFAFLRISHAAQTPVNIAASSGSFTLQVVGGNVWSWGFNGNGQLGDGTFVAHAIPQLVPGLTSVIAVAAGGSHSLALKTDGTVWAWGANFNGQLGNGTFNGTPTPTQVPGLTGIIAIAAGQNHSLALKGDNTVVAWGLNNFGQVGNNTSGNNQLSPVQVLIAGPANLTGITAVAAGQNHSIALKTDGTVWVWGQNGNGQLGDTTQTNTSVAKQNSLAGVATAIAAGLTHSLAVVGGVVWGWGNNSNGQVGDGTSLNNKLTPVATSTLTGVTAVAAGNNHSLALKNDFTVWAWGGNGGGALGDTTTTEQHTPVQSVGVAGASDIAAGNGYSVARLSSPPDAILTWGFEGALGDGIINVRPVPIQISGFPALISQASAGNGHTLVLLTSGAVWGLGSNGNGQLGNNSLTRSLVPVQASGLTSNVTAISAGNTHSLALKADKSVWAWGNNASGQVGNNTSGNNQAIPIQVVGVGNVGTLANIVGISASGTNNHSLAVDSNGVVYAWGLNNNGQLGDGLGTTNHSAPIVVSLTGIFTAVAAGNNHSLALKSDGTVYAWGNNNSAQLGIGSADFTNHFTPVQVPGLTGVVAIAAGNLSSFALKADGSIWAWGANNANPNVFQQATAAFDPIIPAVQSLTAGNGYNLFTVQVAGTPHIWVGGWGSNGNGQLGTGTFNFSSGGVPTLGFAGRTVSSGLNNISANSHSLAVMTDGSLWGWGTDNNGQLGDSPKVFNATPTAPVARGVPDLTISKSHSSEPGAGLQYSYTITVKNVGQATMNGTITVTDTIPEGMSFASGGGVGGWVCGAVSGGASCTNTNAGGLAAGASTAFPLNMNTTALMFPDQFNLATVNNAGDAHAINNVITDETSASTPSTTSLTPAPSPNPSQFGQSVSLNATVTPSAATGVVTFFDNGNILGTAAVTGGTAHLNTIMLGAGPRLLAGIFAPNQLTPYGFSFTPTTLQAVNAIPSASLTPMASSPLVLTGSHAGYLVATGDFNGDGKMDIAAVDGGAHKVTIYSGNGSGGFTAAAGGPFETGVSPVAIIAVDLDGDGKVDLAIANQGALNSVTVLLGNGAGGFTPAPFSPLPVGFTPTSMVVEDINNDGTPRIALAGGPASTQFAKLKHDFGGFFVDDFPLPSGSGSGVAAGDFNGDLVSDLAISYTTGAIGINLKGGDNGYLPQVSFPSSLPHPAGILSAYLNTADTFADLVVWDPTGIEVLLGNGIGTFTKTPQSPFVPGTGSITAITSVQVGDFNGDGKPDLFVVRTPTSTGKGEVVIMLGNGNGGFTQAIGGGYASASSDLKYAVVGEFNGDGTTDIAVTDPGNDAVVVLRGVARVPTKVGIWRPNLFNMVSEDVSGNIAWDSPPDQANFFGATGDTVIFGDWDGSGKTKMGIFRITNGAAMFALDSNGNGVWDAGIDQFGFFGQPGDVPIVGDWTGDGKSKIGIYRPTSGLFALDVNGNLSFDGGVDRTGKFGAGGDTPVIGDWSGTGIYRVGTFKNGLWSLDVDNTLTISAGDSFGVFGQTGDAPLLGDWNGDGKTKVGIYRGCATQQGTCFGGLFGLDMNGSLTFDGPDKGGVLGPGDAGVTPVVGDWDGTGISRVGIFYGLGYWALDINGNLVWDAGIRWGALGAAGDTPAVGRW